jgi:leucyl/phenylalanyl-tRNA--protein transferase
MFSLAPDASKLALAALVAICRDQDISMVDCQQNTRHLASLGAREMDRSHLLAHVRSATGDPSPQWRFERTLWRLILNPEPVIA